MIHEVDIEKGLGFVKCRMNASQESLFSSDKTLAVPYYSMRKYVSPRRA
jgi:hypothetical protein